jgi:hypothetical protein
MHRRRRCGGLEERHARCHRKHRCAGRMHVTVRSRGHVGKQLIPVVARQVVVDHGDGLIGTTRSNRVDCETHGRCRVPPDGAAVIGDHEHAPVIGQWRRRDGLAYVRGPAGRGRALVFGVVVVVTTALHAVGRAHVRIDPKAWIVLAVDRSRGSGYGRERGRHWGSTVSEGRCRLARRDRRARACGLAGGGG